MSTMTEVDPHTVDQENTQTDSCYYLLRLNPKLKKELLHVLTKTKIKNPIFIDQDLYPNSLMHSEQDKDLFYNILDPEYFSKLKKQDPVDIRSYMTYSKRTKKLIGEGTKVIMMLDGQTYTVKQIDHITSTAIVFSELKEIVMKVPLSILRAK